MKKEVYTEYMKIIKEGIENGKVESVSDIIYNEIE